MTEEEKRKLAEEKKRAEEAESARNSSAPPLPTPAPATSTPAPSPAEIRAEEKARVSDITAIAARFDCPDLARAAIDDDLSVEEFRKAVLDHLDKKARENPPPGFRAEITADERDKFRAAAKDGLALRCGLSVETPAAGADVIRGLTLRELARESLRRAGEKPPSNVMEMIGRALTTSDLPLLLADSATQSLFAGWESQPETWRIWCGVDQVGNFLSHSQPRPSELDDLDEVPENAEFPFGSMTEATETYQIVTYGKRFAVSRQAIVNDDLGALTRIPAQHGEAAARKVGDVAYAVLTANAAMGDGTALFHANHSNLESGAAPDITALGSAIKAMKLQKDIGGNRTLNIRPNFFIGPVALELLVEQLLRSDKEGTQAKPGLVNPYAGTYFTRVYEPRLDDDSATAWYLAAPAGKTVTLFFLNGVQAPYLETKQGWSVDGTEYKVRIDVAAKALDWRGLIKNPGA